MGRIILLMVAITVLAVPCAQGGERPSSALFGDANSVGLNHGIVSGQVLRPAQLDSAIRARMDLYKIPAVSAAIVVGDSIVWTGAYGFADVALTIPTTDTTIFKLASISKTFVAMCILQMWENGLISLDSNVNKYLPFPIRNPYYPDDPITIRMLLTHVSTLGDLARIWELTYNEDPLHTLDLWLYNILDESGSYYSPTYYLNVKPGTTGLYSNIGFCVLGLVVQHVTGMSLEQYCRDSIWTPLEMTKTSWFLKNFDLGNIADEAVWASGHYTTAGHSTTPGYPAGQLKTSAPQLAHYVSAFIGHGKYKGVRVLDSATIDSIMTIQYPGTDPLPGWSAEWGLGWFRRNWSPEVGWFWGHEGEIIPGTRTFMYSVPEDHTGAVVLTNSTDNQQGPSANGKIFDLVWQFSRDSDHDGIIAGFDICPDLYNPDQTFVDDDHDGYPDNCEPDVDHDGVLTAADNCPTVANPGQEDANHDGIGDACCCLAKSGNVDCDPGDAVDISDLSALIDNLYISFTPLCCQKEANVDGSLDGNIDISDLSALIDYLYISFTPPTGCS